MSLTQKMIATIILIVMVIMTVMPTISMAVEEVRQNETTQNVLYQEESEQNNEGTANEIENEKEEKTEVVEEQLKQEEQEEQEVKKEETKEIISKEILEKKPEIEKAEENQEGEIVSVDENSVTYKLDDKTFKKVYSAYPNTYKDEKGNEKEIDNTLVEKEENYVNNANDFEVTLPKEEIKEEKPIIVEKDNKKLELIPTEGDFSHSVVLENAIRYNNVFDGIDYQYTSLNIALKEDIILNKKVEKNEFTYLVKASENLTFKQEANYIFVYENENVIYTIEAPIMEDANHELNAGIQLLLEEKEGNTYIKIIANKEWLEAPERAYPVKIDPTITGSAQDHSYFVPVEENVPDLELGSINFTYVGYDNGKATGTGGSGHGIVRIYTKIKLGDIPQESVIKEAKYTVYQRSTFYQRSNSTKVRGEMAVYSVAEDWKGNKSWNNQPFEGQEFIDSKQILSSEGYITYNIRDLVNDWVQGTKPNKGICLRMISENTMQCELIGSKTAGLKLDPKYAPTFSITYTVPDPVDENLPLDDLTINLRPMTEKNNTGKLKFDGVFAEGLSKPGTTVNYWINPFEGFIGSTRASYSYKYPNSEPFNSTFPNANKYKDKLGNWQTDAIYTNPKLNTLYRIHAQAIDAEGNKSSEKTSDSFIIYQVKQKDTVPYIANYYGVATKTILKDNRAQDALLVQNNTLFIRNPSKNVDKPYNPAPLSDQKKKEIDGALRGRHLHCEYGYEPININTGNFYMDKQDVSISEINGEFAINRTYNSTNEGYNSLFGRNWDFEYAESLGKLEDGTIAYFKGDGKTYYFKPDGNGSYEIPYGTDLRIKEVRYNIPEDEEVRIKYEITNSNGEIRKFNSYGLLTNIVDSQGQETKIDYTEELELNKITSPTGKIFNFNVKDGKVTSITLPNKAKLQYEYDENSNLIKFIDAVGNTEIYEYNEKGQMTACIDKNGVTSVKNEYDEQGRVTKQIDAKEQVVTLKYENGKTISTDANGNVTIYYYNDRYYTTKVEYPTGLTEEKSYDDNGNLIQYKDKSGNITKYEYDSNHNKVKEIRADGVVSTIEYNKLNKPSKVVDFDGSFITYEYDEKGNLIRKVDQAGITNSYTYDNKDRLTSKTDANGNTTKYNYDGANITEVEDANGNVSKLYYNELNQVTSIENAKGEVKRISYDKNGNKTLEQFPDGSTNTYVYDAKSRVIATIDAKGNKTEYIYDNTDNVVKVIKPDGGIITMQYDANKNKTKEIDELGRENSYRYDALNRVISQIDSNGNETKYEYNGVGNITKVTDANGHSTQMKFNTIINAMTEEIDAKNNSIKYEYNNKGLLTKKIDKDGLVTEYAYDEVNRIKEQKLPTGETITYTYDNNDNLLKVESNSGKSYTYQYDKLNNVTKIIDPLGNEQTIYYDIVGNRTKVTDINGESSVYTYDKMGRVTKAQNQLKNIEQFEYDSNGNQTKYIDFKGNETTYEYDTLNRISKKVDALGNVTKYKYDSVGNVISEINALGNETESAYTANNQIAKITDANGHIYQLKYDKVGNNTKVIDAKGNEVTLEYDNEDNLIKVINAEGVITDYEYDAAGRITVIYDSTGNRMEYTYDKGRLVKLQDNTGRTIEYQYDLTGNVIQIKNYDDTVSKYEYDLLDRLTKVIDPEEKAITFEYDKTGNLIKKTDSSERVWKYEYDKLGNVTKYTDPQSATTTFEYDANSNLLQTINAKKDNKVYTYDALNRITSITDENKATTTIDYDAISQITSVKKPEGGTLKYAYDKVGNVISSTDELKKVTNYVYDEIDNLIQVKKANGATTNYEYNTLGNITKITDALGNVTNNKINANGLTEEITLANGAKYTYTYDEAKRLTKVTAPEGVEKTFNYDKADNLIEEIDANGNSTRYEYDIMKRLIGVTNANDNKTSYNYDMRGNLSSIIDAKGAMTKYEYNIVDQLEKQIDPTGIVNTFEYDILGNLIKQDRAGGRTTTYEYDKVGNLTKTTNALGNVQLYTYNKENNITSMTDQLGNISSYKYDLKGQIIEVINTKNAKTQYGYDSNGNVTSVVDALGNMKKYSYDLLDRLVEVEDEKSHKTSYKYDNVGNLVEQTNANGNITTYNYDLLSRVKQEIDANGNITTYNYDAVSNLKEVIKADGNTITYDYDKINELISKESEQDEDINTMYGYDVTGKLINMEDCLGNTSYEYDEFGRISKVTLQDGKQLEYKYDELSRLNEIVYPDGKSVKYTYNVLDKLETIIDRDGNTTTYEYDAKARIVKTIRPNGSYTVVSYNELDAINKLENFIKNSNGEETVSTFEYTYNEKEQIVKEVASNQGSQSVKEFIYDEKGELIVYKENIDGISKVTNYSYDNVGNRISKEVTLNEQIVKTDYTYNELNQLLKEKTNEEEINYKYDANGNLIEKQSSAYTYTYNYTVEDRLQAIKDGNTILMAAIYDGNGDRVFSVSPKNYKVKSNNGNHYGQNNGNSGNNGSENNNGNGNDNGNNGNHYGNENGNGNKNSGNLNNNGNGNQNGNNGNHYGNDKGNTDEEIEEITEGEKYSANVIDYNHNGKISVGEMKRANKQKQAENEEMIFIPLGISHKDRNKYELTQYINDVTTQNTQVLMEYGKKAKDTVAYNYGYERLSYEDAKNKNKADTYTYNYDGRGSVTNILDITGTSVVEYNYDSFGEATITGVNAKKTANKYQFNAEATDSVTGLQYLRARYYDNTIGRFISEDTYLGDIYDPLTRNQYLYTNNDPVNYIDPSGHFFDKIFNAVKEYGKAAINTVGYIGSRVWDNIVNRNATPNLIGETIGLITTASNNFSTAKQNVQNYNNNKNKMNVASASTNKRNQVAVLQGPSLPKTNSTNTRYSYRSASVVPKVEKSRELENQIKYLKQQNTPEARKMASYLQENMKKLCESSRSHIQVSDVAYSSNTTSAITQGGAGLLPQNVQDAILSFGYGASSEIPIQLVGNLVAPIYGVANMIDGGSYSVGVENFNIAHINPIRDSIKEKLPNEQAYWVGVEQGKQIAITMEIAAAICSIVAAPEISVPILGNIASRSGGTIAIAMSEVVTTSGTAVAVSISSAGMAVQMIQSGNNSNKGDEVDEIDEKWNAGSFDTSKDSLEYHFNKHGKSVGATTQEQYFRKAEAFSKNLKGATKKKISGTVKDVTRYYKNGKYIDIAPDGTIVSFGIQ